VNNSTDFHNIFIAIPVEKELQAYIYQIISNLYSHYSSLRWINHENYHVTLHYLGSVKKKQLTLLVERIKPIIEAYSSFSLKLETATPFPSQHKPHSLVVSVKLSFLLNSLYETFKKEIEECGIDLPPHTYNPHITLAQLKKNGWIGNTKRLPHPFKIPVQSIDILQSLTEEEPSQFRKLASFELSYHKIEA